MTPLPFIVKNCGPYALQEMDNLVGALKAEGFAFKTCAQIAEETP